MTPKLSQLTPEQKTRLLAELDGFTHIVQIAGRNYNVIPEQFPATVLPDYPTSYDAIIPLMQKLKKETSGRSIKNTYRFFLIALFQICNPEQEFGWESQYWTTCITATPSQLSDAVLVATGKAEL